MHAPPSYLGASVRRGRPFALASALQLGSPVAERPISARSSRFALAMATVLAFGASGCSVAQLPACLEPSAKAPVATAIPPSRQALIGIDGSASMAGFLNGSGGGEAWKQLLKAIKLTATGSGSGTTAVYRVGGRTGTAVGTITEAADPCFFGGCPGRPSLASSLHTLWAIPAAGAVPPLRVMVSDLEVNQGDISALRQAIQADLGKGASIGVLGVRLPFEGTVFDSDARPLHVGKANRPVYLLITGSRAAVESFLDGVRQTLALSGFSGPIERSLLGAGPTTLTAVTAWGEPRGTASTGLPVRIGGTTYGPSGNDNYQLVKLLPGATGLAVSSSKGLGAAAPGASPAPAGLMTLTPLALAGAGADGSLQGVAVSGLAVSGRQLVARFRVPPGTPAGAFRATVEAGGLPEPWWLTWSRSNPGSAEAKDQTDNLLLTLTSLSRAAVPAGSHPAVAFCVAFTT
jgi:hypothetical protein